MHASIACRKSPLFAASSYGALQSNIQHVNQKLPDHTVTWPTQAHMGHDSHFTDPAYLLSKVPKASVLSVYEVLARVVYRNHSFVY